MPETIPDDQHLAKLPDEQLWALVHRKIAWPQDARLRELTALGKQETLSTEEQPELESLIDAYDQYVLLRSQALLHLKRRGYDVEQRLNLVK